MEKKISGFQRESNPHSCISDVMLYQLTYQATWEQRKVRMLVLGAHENQATNTVQSYWFLCRPEFPMHIIIIRCLVAIYFSVVVR